MKKSKIMLAIAVALTVSITGCGTKNSDTAESQKETVTKTADDKNTENQKKVSEKTAEKSEETGLKNEENVVKADEKAVAQQTSSVDTSDTDSSSNDSSVNNTSSSNNTSGTSSTGSVSSSGSTSSGGSSNANTNNNSGNNNASNSNTNPAPTPAQPVHTHTWVHVDATGHWETVTIQEAWDEEVPVYEERELSICNQCGADITGNTTAHLKANIETCWGYHSEWKWIQTGIQVVHHDAVTEQRWVQDSPAYDQCSGCGATK